MWVRRTLRDDTWRTIVRRKDAGDGGGVGAKGALVQFGWGWGMCGDAGAEFAARGFVWRVRGAFQRWWGALGLVHRSWT